MCCKLLKEGMKLFQMLIELPFSENLNNLVRKESIFLSRKYWGGYLNFQKKSRRFAREAQKEGYK